MRAAHRRFEAGLPGTVGAVENHVTDRVTAEAIALNRRDGRSMRQNMDGDRLVAADQALAGQVLLQFQGLGGECLSDTADTTVEQGCETAEMNFAFFQIALPDALILDGQQQAALFTDFQFAEPRRGQQG